MKIVGHSSGITNRKSVHISVGKPEIGTSYFIGVDGEGIKLPNGEHRYVLFAVGDKQIENENGLEWRTIFDFLYRDFLSRYNPKRSNPAYVGFYLGYDFDLILSTMPANRVAKLLTKPGIAIRKNEKGGYYPVDLPYGWQIDMLGKKKMSIRKRACNCDLSNCGHYKGPWMHICDAGPFFQTSFVKAIDPATWKNPIVNKTEYELIVKGKANRADADHVNDEMRYYNKLENKILARLMKEVDKGFREMGITLTPTQWFGPGQVAQQWMKKERVTKREEIEKTIPSYFLKSAGMSYFGGWFEIMMHGHIPGITHEYDINSAYPHIIASLPCLLHGIYKEGKGASYKDTGYVLVRASVSNFKKDRAISIGTMLHRDKHGNVLRPRQTIGWFWLHELKAAKRANLIDECEIHEWASYDPCDCLPPMRNVQFLYDLRIKVGKDTPLGKGCRLAYNSMYGKTAQSIGNPIFANPVWASLITAGCRTMILDAIATHPMGRDAVAMVATDAVYFLTPHPSLPLSKRLGEWEHTAKNNLTLFKPGVYWDDKARQDINEGQTPVFKSRGISVKDFAASIEAIDMQFTEWNIKAPECPKDDGITKGWPFAEIKIGFTLISCLQALMRNKWWMAGKVMYGLHVLQNANPHHKRNGIFKVALDDGRIVWRSMPWCLSDNDQYSFPYMKRFGIEDPWSLENEEAYGIVPDGPLGDLIMEGLNIR